MKSYEKMALSSLNSHYLYTCMVLGQDGATNCSLKIYPEKWSKQCAYMCHSWGGGGNLVVILVRVCEPVFFLKPSPIIYLAFEKIDIFIYLIEQNIYIFIYCSLIIKYSLCCL